VQQQRDPRLLCVPRPDLAPAGIMVQQRPLRTHGRRCSRRRATRTVERSGPTHTSPSLSPHHPTAERLPSAAAHLSDHRAPFSASRPSPGVMPPRCGALPGRRTTPVPHPVAAHLPGRLHPAVVSIPAPPLPMATASQAYSLLRKGETIF